MNVFWTGLICFIFIAIAVAVYYYIRSLPYTIMNLPDGVPVFIDENAQFMMSANVVRQLLASPKTEQLKTQFDKKYYIFKSVDGVSYAAEKSTTINMKTKIIVNDISLLSSMPPP